MVVTRVLLVFVSATLSSVWAGGRPPVPGGIYEYMKLRDTIRDKMEEKPETKALTDDEMIVDKYMRYMKLVEFERTKSNQPSARPLAEALPIIKQGDVYHIMRKFPKGGNMHSHENHQLSKKILYDIVWASSEFNNLYMVSPNHRKGWMLNFFTTPPTDMPWIKVKGSSYTKEQILEKQTLMGILSSEALKYPSDTAMRWRDLDPLWGRGSSQLINNEQIRREFLIQTYNMSLLENVQYIETRSSLPISGKQYRLSNSSEYAATNGQQLIDPTGVTDVELVKRAQDDFIAANPDFIGHKVIIQKGRSSSRESVMDAVNKSIAAYKRFPEVVGGFDLVSEEDLGHSGLFFVENYLKYDVPSQIPFYLHTAETNIPIDLMSSEQGGDLVPTLENALDSILMGARRVGHGVGYFKHPELMDLLRERDVAVEVCPISNQILGYTPDIRNHPGSTYLREGIPIVFGSDDAGTFGNNDLTFDWYMAFMSWELTLGSMREIALNSLRYSSMSEERREAAIKDKWTPRWNSWVAEMKAEACSKTFTTQPTFVDIYPRQAATNIDTRVHVFGRNFEVGVCKKIKCKFGDAETSDVKFVTSRHIICVAPSQDKATHDVSVALDGTTFVNTGHKLEYSVFDVPPTKTTRKPTSAAPQSHTGSISIMFLIVALLLLIK